MELSALTAYASEKYRIREEHRWADFPSFSVLCHPQTGKWVALLMRQWDGEHGEEIERCDLKCGAESLSQFHRPYLSPPIRMHGGKWIDIAFDDRTEEDVVFRLFDKAISAGAPQGYTIVLASRLPLDESAYRDTALPFAGSAYRPPKEELPEPLREMKRLYEYGRASEESRARNFYKQAVFLEDYEDDVPWSGDFICYYPTYHDLNTQQLRGYFSWRAQVRKGVFQPIAASAAYIYLYELLNCVGADSPEDSLRKLRAFEIGYLDSGIGDRRMRRNLRRWMLEFAVLHELPSEQARQAAEADMIAMDGALSVLRRPDAFSDEEVFSALCALGGKKTADSPVIALDPEGGRRLFSESWRAALSYRWQENDLFTLCFGKRVRRPWYPLSTAVCCPRERPENRDYALDDCRSYHCRNGAWQVYAYEKRRFDRDRLQGFLHEADARLRRYLKTGRYLRENPADEWAVPYIDAVIEADKKARLEAARPKITIDLSGLDQIRRDAAGTRDSLLTGEEPEESDEPEPAAEPASEQAPTDLPLDAVQLRILRALLQGGDAAEIIRANHLMPSIAADFINEALFDEFGDTVLLCKGDRLSLVEDYTEELEEYLGGTSHG